MVTSFKRAYASILCLPGLLYSVPLTPQQATVNPRLQPTVQETPGHSWASLAQSLMGHCCFLLGPGGHKVLFVPSKIHQIPLAHQSQIPWGFSVPMPDPQAGKSVVGPRTFATVLWLVPWFSVSDWLTSLGVIRFATSPVSASHFLIDTV